MKLEFHNGGTLDGLGFYVFNSSDIKKVVLVIIGQIPLHLERIHAAIRLSDVNGGDSQRREYIPGHPLGGGPGAQQECNDGD
jgi:hypothetical protein